MEAGDEFWGVFRNGQVELEGMANWPEGARVLVRAAPVGEGESACDFGDVVVAGFGLAGRYVVELIERNGARVTVVERNPSTVKTQRALGRHIIEGSIADPAIAREAGVETASVLALTIPDEVAVLRATELARRLNPNIYIIARTTYASRGMKALQLGADDVVKSEQAVAAQFYEKLQHKLRRGSLTAN